MKYYAANVKKSRSVSSDVEWTCGPQVRGWGSLGHLPNVDAILVYECLELVKP